MKRYIRSGTQDTLNAALRKGYLAATPEELADICGCSVDELGSAENLGGYDAKHLGWYIAKEQYSDLLADSGYDIVELVREGTDGKPFIGFTVGYELLDITDEVAKILGV